MDTKVWVHFPVSFLVFVLISPSNGWSAEPVTIDLTTSAGRRTYEIVRLYPDRVVLLDAASKRTEIRRSQIQKASNKKIEDNIKQARDLLAKVPSTSWEQFGELARTLEQSASGMDQASLLYGWLIPDASKTALDLQAVNTQVNQILVTGTAIEHDLLDLSERLKQGERLADNWSALFEEGAKRAGTILYPAVKSHLITRIQSERKNLESLVKQVTAEKTDGIEKAGKRLHERCLDPAITRDEWASHLEQMNQTADQIPETKARENSLAGIEEIRKETEPLLLAAERRRAYTEARDQLEKIQTQVSNGELTPATGQERIRAFLTSLANLPNAPTRELLATQANDFAVKLAPKPLTGTGIGEESKATDSPAGTLYRVLQPMLASKTALGGVVGLAISIGGLVLLSWRKRRKPTTQTTKPVALPEPQSGPVPEFPTPENVIPLPVRIHPGPASIPGEQPHESSSSIPISEPSIEEPISPILIAGDLASIPEQEEDLPLIPSEEVQESTSMEVLETEHPAWPVNPPEVPEPETHLIAADVEEAPQDDRLSGVSVFPPAEVLGVEPPHELQIPISEPFSPTESETGIPCQKPPEKISVPEMPEGILETSVPLPILEIPLPFMDESWQEILGDQCVLDSDLENQLREVLVLGEGTPEALLGFDRYFAVSMQKGEGKTTIALVDRLAPPEKSLSVIECGSGRVALSWHLGVLWILNPDCLRIMAPTTDDWIELGQLDHLPVPPEEGMIPVDPVLIWVGDNYLAGLGTHPHLYRVETQEDVLRIEPLPVDIVKKAIPPGTSAVFPWNGELAVVSQEGLLSFVDLSIGFEGHCITLPGYQTDADKRLLHFTPVGSLLYPCIDQRGKPFLRLFSLSSMEVDKESELLMVNPTRVIPVEEGYLLFGGYKVAFLDEMDLSVSWTYPLGNKKPVELNGCHTQIALLAHDAEEGDTILVLGKNSGADLWDLTSSEHGLKQVQSLVFHEEWTLLLGRDEAGNVVLKLC